LSPPHVGGVELERARKQHYAVGAAGNTSFVEVKAGAADDSKVRCQNAQASVVLLSLTANPLFCTCGVLILHLKILI